MQQLGGVVADLFELGHRGEHIAASGDPVRVLDPGHHVVDHHLVQRSLLGGETTVLLDLDLLGQVVDDRRIGLDATQDVGTGDRPQPLGRFGVAVLLHRDRIAGAEDLRGTEHPPGVEEIHDRVQLGEPVLYRGAGQRYPVTCVQTANSFAPRDNRFFTACASSSTTRCQRRSASCSMSRTAVA